MVAISTIAIVQTAAKQTEATARAPNTHLMSFKASRGFVERSWRGRVRGRPQRSVNKGTTKPSARSRRDFSRQSHQSTPSPPRKEPPMIGTALTAIIGIVAKGVAAKARAGGIATAVVAVGGPVFDMARNGFVEGIGPSIEQVGLLAGQAVGAFIVGYAVTWFAPKNAPAK